MTLLLVLEYLLQTVESGKYWLVAQLEMAPLLSVFPLFVCLMCFLVKKCSVGFTNK